MIRLDKSRLRCILGGTGHRECNANVVWAEVGVRSGVGWVGRVGHRWAVVSAPGGVGHA